MATILQQIHPRRWVNGLWRNPDFVKLWGSLTITHFGGQVTFLALPLTAALLLNASPFEVGVLTALEALPFALLGLPAGVLVDRFPKLPIIIAADVGRALALLAVPVCAWLGVLSMPILYIVGFLVGTGSIIGWPAYQVFMTERVGRSNLVEANAKIGISDSAAQLVGPGIAGMLIQWLTAPFAILLDAICFLVSAMMLRGIPPATTDAPKARPRNMLAEIREGLAVVWHNPTLRSLVWSIGLWQVFRHAFIAIVVLYAARELGFSAGHVGVMFMMAGVGSLAAATFTLLLWTMPSMEALISRIELSPNAATAARKIRRMAKPAPTVTRTVLMPVSKISVEQESGPVNGPEGKIATRGFHVAEACCKAARELKANFDDLRKTV